MRISQALSIGGRVQNSSPPSVNLDLHVRIIWSAATFRRRPCDVLSRVFNVACFAVNAILSIDDKAGVQLCRFILIDDFINASRAVKTRGFAVSWQIVFDRNGRV